MPWSCAAGTKCVPISPLVVAPQIAKPTGQRPERARPRRRRRGSGRSAGRRPTGCHRQLALVTAGEMSRRHLGRHRPGQPLSRSSRSCRTRRRRPGPRDRPGSSGRTAAPAAPRPAQRPATISDADRQPYCSESQAISGRKTNWPAAPPAVSTPITSPRRLTNHRFAMVAAKTSAIDPVPRPISTPQVSTSCQPAVTKTVSPLPSATSTRAQQVILRMPNRSISAAANGAVRP